MKNKLLMKRDYVLNDDTYNIYIFVGDDGAPWFKPRKSLKYWITKIGNRLYE